MAEPTLTPFSVSGSTVLITGGASGIGLALAGRFLDAGASVIVVGRREEKLAEARSKFPSLITFAADVATEQGREALFSWVVSTHSEVNVLVNNAGIQRYPKLADPEPFAETRVEIATNLDAPIHLCSLFIPHLKGKTNAALINVTSGLSFVPMAKAPVYSATKAALHSYTVSLRHHLVPTGIRVIEIVPPAVDTDLGGPGLHTFGVPVEEFVSNVMPRVFAGESEVAYGFAAVTSRASRDQVDKIFIDMCSRFSS